MRTIELIPGVEASVLGFGCAPILGSVGAKMAQRAIHCALDCGVTYFDLARSYGYGEAEAFVGRALRGRRDQIVLASKFGIRANWKAGLLAPLKPLARLARGFRKGKTPKRPHYEEGSRVADRFHERLPLRADVMRQSLEKSLRALGTDYLDVLLVHEPKESLVNVNELAEAAVALKEEGKIRSWGLSFMWEEKTLFQEAFERFDVLQFNNSPVSPHYDGVRAMRGAKPNIFFSPFSGSSGGMTPAEILRALYSDFPGSIVLCSMFREVHIRENTRIAGLRL